jgi:hypothetical protein
MSGLLQIALQQGKIDLAQMAVDGSFPPSPGGGQEVAHGHKGKGTVLHLLIDGLGNPLAITTTVKELRTLGERMTILEADRDMMRTG